jgi:hypothetical protein
MTQKKAQVEIKGKTPLLMHKYPLHPVEALEKKTREEQAEIAAYRDEKSRELIIPGLNIQRALVAGAAYSKGKGRASLQKPAAACLQVGPDSITLGAKEYEVDSRRVVVPATRGAVVRHRPRLSEWGCGFTIEYDDTLLTEQQVRRIVDDTGDRVGLLDFRPEKKGPFGRYMVTKWKVS